MIRRSHSSHNDIDRVNHITHRREELTMITDEEHNASHKRGSSEMTATAEKLTRPAGHPVVAILTFTLRTLPQNGDGDGPLRGFLPAASHTATPQLASNLGKTANRRPTRPLDTCAVTPPSIYDVDSLLQARRKARELPTNRPTS